MAKPLKSKNYLDFIPVQNPEMETRENQQGNIVILLEWKGFYHRIAQKLFHKPRVSEIALDEYGSFVWRCIDGKKDVHALSQILSSHFTSMEKPLPRLIRFLEVMYEHHFIKWKEGMP